MKERERYIIGIQLRAKDGCVLQDNERCWGFLVKNFNYFGFSFAYSPIEFDSIEMAEQYWEKNAHIFSDYIDDYCDRSTLGVYKHVVQCEPAKHLN